MNFKEIEQVPKTESDKLHEIFKCKHVHKEEIDGTVFCVSCRLTFWRWSRVRLRYYDFNQHHPRNDQDVEIEQAPKTEPAPKSEPASKAESEPTPAVTSVKDLQKLPKKHGVKFYTRMVGA